MVSYPTFQYEEALWKKGVTHIAGIDEVGRGAFAGPVVAAAVILPPSFICEGINDSKLLTPAKRVQFARWIRKESICFSIAEVGLEVINQHGISYAAQLAFTKALSNLTTIPQHVLIDGFLMNDSKNTPQQALIKGDRRSISIAAASIIAKVYRDALMEQLHHLYPAYNFARNKGYGTKHHRVSLKEHGLSPHHRTSFQLTKFL